MRPRTPWPCERGRRADHPDDPNPDLRPPRGTPGPIESRVDLPRRGQLEGEHVARLLAVARGKLGGDVDLVDPARIQQPALHDDWPLDGARQLPVRGDPLRTDSLVALDRESETDREQAQRLYLRQRPDLGPVKARLVGQDGCRRGQRLGPQPVEGGVAAPRSGDSRQNRRRSQRDQEHEHDAVIAIAAAHPAGARSQLSARAITRSPCQHS